MQSANIPSKIPLPFAYAAGSGYINTIPTASQIGITDGRASLHDGFPPDTFTPITSGGVPPFGGDFNGILNEITSIQQWQEAGGFFPFDNTFATAIGGYPKGAVLQSSTLTGFWISTAENNTNNPDTNGAGWSPILFEGTQSIVLSGSSVTLTAVQAAYPILIFTGALTQNCNVILPTIAYDWIVVNNTTNNFNVQVKTASGTGVNIAQGYSTYIYGDGTNINYSNSAQVSSFNGRAGTVTLNALDVTNALGYTPYNATNPSGFISGITGTMVVNALGYTPYNSSNPNGYINGINATMIDNALGYAPANPNTLLGVGQTWQDVTSSRTSGVTYTNSTNRPIQVCVTFPDTGGTAIATVIVNGVTLFNATYDIGSGSATFAPQFIVPSGQTYSCTASGSASIQRWVELR